MFTSIFITFIMMMNNPTVIFDSSTNNDLVNWQVVDDVVMGGLSDGSFYISNEGFAVFAGKVSLANNGGFSSVRCRIPAKTLDDFTKLKISIKGDGKRYQLRVKSKSTDRHSYITYFETSGQWQDIEIELNALYPSFRGRKLEMPNYNGQILSEIGFLIGNKREESFKLQIASISLQ